MLRILLCIAATSVIAFWMMAMGATPGFENYDTLQLVGAANLIIGVGVLLIGFVLMTYSDDDRNKAMSEHFVIFGVLIAAFGLGIYPFIPEKVFAVPLCLALSFAMARISFKAFRAANHFGLGIYGPVMMIAACGFGSVWALASGWNWMQAGSFILVGIPGAFIAAFTRPVQRQPIPAT